MGLAEGMISDGSSTKVGLNEKQGQNDDKVEVCRST